jgi:hypothetical protein
MIGIIGDTTRGGTIVLLEWNVRRSKKAPTEFSHKMKSGMGVQTPKFSRRKDRFQIFPSIALCKSLNCQVSFTKKPYGACHERRMVFK